MLGFDRVSFVLYGSCGCKGTGCEQIRGSCICGGCAWRSKGGLVVSATAAWKRSLALVAAAFAALCVMLALSVQPAQAKVMITDGIDDVSITSYTAVAEAMDGYGTGVIFNVQTSSGGKAKIKKVTSSKKKVAHVYYQKKSDWFTVDYCCYTGKSTITVKTNKGTAKLKFKVKYTCPVKSFKVAGKSYTKKFKKCPLVATKKTLKNKKVTVKAKKGWVITHVSTTKWSNSKGEVSKDKTIKDKKSYKGRVTVKYPLGGISITFKNTKTDQEQTLSFERNTDDLAHQAG